MRIISFPYHLLILSLLLIGDLSAAEPLRVFVRAGVKTHGPNQHDHPRFLAEAKSFLPQRGISVDGALDFPTAEQLAHTDILVIYAADGMNIVGTNRDNFETFLKRGGGLVVIHDGLVSGDQHAWAKKVIGGAWRWDGDRKTKWQEGEVGIYFVDTTHPITHGISNFDWKDEIYYDLDMAPDVSVLATSFENIFILAPQIWTYEKTWEGGSAPYRAFVSIPGHEFDVFTTPHYRAILLRGLAWAGKRANVDEFCRPEEISEMALRYPAGGPTQPDRAAEKISVHPDFNLNLVASEPLIEKVISLDWAPDGKLWVAETPEYPNGRTINSNDAPIYPDRVRNPNKYLRPVEERPGRDRISWLEDADGDGKMDSKHVFYEGLELVTSFVFYKDGVIVEQAPDILWLRDTDGDGKADKVEVLYTGFGTNDTHAVINNMRWGLDGWIYSAVGYSAGHPTSADETKDFGRITAGVIRFKPDGSMVEQVASGSCNTWGFDLAPDGEMFYSTATCGEHLLHIVMPEKVLARGNVGNLRASAVIPDHQKVAPLVHHKRQAYLQIDWVGMFTASAGSCIYNGGAWPEQWNHTHFLSEPTVSLTHSDFLTPNGATYVARKEAGQENNEFLAGTDLWFRPIHTRVGPDGALYVVDFYNQAVVHNDTRGPAHGARNAATRPDRDHHFARIWRVQHKSAKILTELSLDNKNPAAWLTALSSENGWLRMTAHRLITERGGAAEVEVLGQLLANPNTGSITRMHLLYLLNNLHRLDDKLLSASLHDGDSVVRKNALGIVAERDPAQKPPEISQVTALLKDPDLRVQLNAFIALGTFRNPTMAYDFSTAVADAIIDAWPGLQDPYVQSAAIGCADMAPMIFEAAAFKAANPHSLAELVRHFTQILAKRQDPGLAAQLVILASQQDSRTDELKQIVLETLSKSLQPDLVVAWNEELRHSLATLVKSSSDNLASSTLPLIARWDKDGTMANEIKPFVARLRRKLSDPALNDEQRGSVIEILIGIRTYDTQIIPDIASFLGGVWSTQLQRNAIELLGSTREPEAGSELAAAFARVPVDLREVIFGQLIKRADWSLKLVEALAENKVDPAAIGPINAHRLRTHSDARVAAKASEVLDALRGPQQQQKDILIAQLLPSVRNTVGSVENGHKLFTVNCSVCHSYKGEGRDLAPNLTGMGAHGPADLLVHIVDPNRQVEPNFYSTSIETKDDLSFSGIIAHENNQEVTLRNATGDYNIRVADIASRRMTGLSLMPEGFEALGAEGLRDLLAYLCLEDQGYRILDLASAFTVNTSRGIYVSREDLDDAPVFRKYGLNKVGDIPFDIVNPQRLTQNAIVLRGGEGFSKTLPQRVDVKVRLTVSRLHFLGGIGAGAWPIGGDTARNLPVLKATLHLADGGTEDMVFHNGIEFTDWKGQSDVPGSKNVPNIARRGQLRLFSRDVKSRAIVDSISLESFNNSVAPTLIGITAEIVADEPKIPASPSSSSIRTNSRVLIIGAGSSHDFKRWFLEEDSRMLTTSGDIVRTTESPDEILRFLGDLDVLYLSNNAPFTNRESRQALINFANSGKGLLLVHPALWYNWKDWPEYNIELCGGGSRGHDHYDTFEVTVTEPDHPLMRGLPSRFTVKDELYWFEPATNGTPIKVLATAHSPSQNKDFPMIFIVEHPKSRIAGIALGHDGAVHDLPAYQQLLRNAVRWAGRAEATSTIER